MPTNYKDSSLIVSQNPATLDVLGQWPSTTREEVIQTTKRAQAAQVEFGALSVTERCKRLISFQKILTTHAADICALISQETGKPEMEALLTEVIVVLDHARYFLKKGPAILKPEPISLHLLKNRSSYLTYTPRGVVGIISPWNFPWSIPLCETIMALVAGNAVVLKPSEVTPMVALKAKEYFDESGLPKDLFQVVIGRGDTGAALIDSGIDYCIFTGSTQTGRRIAAACGERLIPCTLELGGKTPALVCKDADIERTAKALVWGAFANSGQVCVSIERAYVHQEVYDDLLAALQKEVASLRQGIPLGAEVDVGCMTWSKQVDIVKAHVKKAIDQGATVLCGGIPTEESGLFFAPTILVDCRQEMDVMRHEIFGPLLPIMKISSDEEGIALCNDSPFGLMGYVFSNDRYSAKRIAEQIRAGTVMVNDTLITFAAPETPWGGIGQSGIGRSHSDKGLQDLCHVRHINTDRIRLRRELWWYPYSHRLYQAVLRWVKRW